MAADEITKLDDAETNEPTGAELLPVEPTQPPTEPPERPGWTRRAFFQAAALGAAAAAFLDGKQFAPSIAFADDLSDNPCTANDIDVCCGVVQNEQCPCTGATFPALVSFQVTNNTSAQRYCVSIHVPDGLGGLPSQNIVLTTSPGGGSSIVPPNQTITMYGTVQGFPCNATGDVVLGPLPCGNVVRGKCSSGTCATISFNTSAQDSCPNDTPPRGQCRHETICIRGYGATLSCTAGCPPVCGGKVTLRGCAIGPTPASGADRGPYRFSLDCGAAGIQNKGPISTSSDGTACVDFDVIVNGPTTCTLTVTDASGCTRTAPVSLNASPVSKPTLSAGKPDCAGKVTYTVSNCDSSLTYTYQEVNCSTGAVIGTLSGGGKGVCSLDHTFPQDGADHCVICTASNGNATCDATSDKVTVHINAPVTSTLNPPTVDCTGVLTFTASGSGGSGGYKFTFSVDGTVKQGPDSSSTFKYGPVVDGVSHTYSVRVTDSAGCSSTATDDRIIKVCAAIT